MDARVKPAHDSEGVARRAWGTAPQSDHCRAWRRSATSDYWIYFLIPGMTRTRNCFVPGRI